MIDQSAEQPESLRQQIDRLLTRVFPWILFPAFLLWGWRVKDLFHNIPAYGDALEQLWGITWYGDHLFDGGFPSLFPSVFLPHGWLVNTSSNSPAMFLVLLPLYKLGGAPFAYNMAVLSSFLVAYAGAYLLARKFGLSTLYASVVAVLFTFCGFRWIRINGHLHVLLASSLLPWLLTCLERAMQGGRRSRWWFAAAGVLWGLASAISYYFVWIGGMVVLGWLIGRWAGGRIHWHAAVVGIVLAGLCALVLCGPILLLYVRASAAADVPTADIGWTVSWGASLNTLPLPFVLHPLAGLRSLHRWLYHGPLDESGIANLGLLASVLALIGIYRTRRDRMWWPVVSVVCLGLLFALGYILRWDGNAVQWQALRGLDKAIWSLGHYLKPGFFRAAEPYGPFVQGVPLPSLILAAVIPFWEGARTLSRFAFVALPGFFLLAMQGVLAFRRRLIRCLLAALLLLEVLPFSSGSVSASPPSHPAFDWIREQTRPDDGLIDLYAPRPNYLGPMFGGEILWAIQYHQRATAAGAGSVWPAHTWFLSDWFAQHSHPFDHPDVIPLLGYYDVNYVLLHMLGRNEQSLLTEIQHNPSVSLVNCFAPSQGASPWAYPICVFKIVSEAHSRIGLVLDSGWSGPEPWGVWAEGTESHARWIATTRADARISVEAFPMCVPGQEQVLSVQVNGTEIATHRWRDCESWSGEFILESSQIRIGWNDLILEYDHSAKPSEITNGKNPDSRSLSVGFTELQFHASR